MTTAHARSHPRHHAQSDGSSPPEGPLVGVRVLDLSRVLAGPSCTQLLGDLGADIIKIERPRVGDETRTWGPPFVKDKLCNDTTESGYYLSANRNKRSVAIDISKPEGQALVKQLLAHCDILIENFKVGGLKKYGLDYPQLKAQHPTLVYCSITGFGQTGPYASRPGYDMMAQGAGGIMSITGEPGGPPAKVGVAINDIMTGMYATVSILSALRHRDQTGAGQHIDLGLLDVQVAWLYNQGLNYLTGGIVPGRLGTAHPNSVPYQVFPSRDGYFILAANNDEQFQRFCRAAGLGPLLADPRYATNADRVVHRDTLIPAISERTLELDTDDWLERLQAAQVGCAPVNTIDRVFADPQIQHRGMEIEMPHPLSGTESVKLIGNPIKFSESTVSYRRSPPTIGQHTREVLDELLDLGPAALDRLNKDGII